ncbi:MAG TPA: phosphodiester glycosidase family protein, partial [Candidatus Avacidaminococcus intestinavium]|nr:phosphodiester glycosidase family protein [Candidatus Avacidaminococcus intestinavium]
MRIKFLTIIFVLLFYLPVDAAVIKSVRTGVAPDKTRIVIDLDEPVKYTEQLAGDKLKVTIDAKTSKKVQLTPKSEWIKQVTLIKQGKKGAELTVDLAKAPGTYKVFLLKGPDRLVIDFYRFVLAKQSTILAPGVSYLSWRDYQDTRPVWLHVVEATPASNYALRPVLGKVATIDKAKPSAIAANTGALALINASYFDSTKWVIGNLKIDGVWASAEMQARTALAINKNGQTRILAPVAYQGKVLAGGNVKQLTGVNRERINNDLILYNRFFGTSTTTNQYGIEVRIKDGRVIEVSNTGNMTLDESSEVLSGHGAGAEFLQKLKKGNRVYLTHDLSVTGLEKTNSLVGAGPLLVEGGRKKVLAELENFANDIKVGRAPRTAVGVKADGSILLVVVDGRSVYSSGLTLNELADYMIKLGAISAMNFDGGGSSAMIIKNQVVNKPSDGSERPVRVALGLFSK